LLDKANRWIEGQRLQRRQRSAERAAIRLRSLIDRNVQLSENMIEAVVERERPKVLEILSRIDPTLQERALTFSQEGEDLILMRIFAGRSKGFFVDVGAYHPFRFSNTFLFYNAGWRGINVDATPGSMQAFEKFRPEDTNIECFVGNPGSEKLLTQYNEPALNTAAQAVLESRALPASRYWAVSTSAVHPRSLSSILDEYKPTDISIDFLNLDVEGSEQEVLESNDWSRYRPEVVVIEQLSTDVSESMHHPTTAFLRERGYRLIAKAFNSTFFRLEERC
jgi:FkbM family methyltransferase